MVKIFLITVLLSSTGVVRHEELFVGEAEILSPEYDTWMNECKAWARQREFTYYTPKDYLGSAHFCEVQP